MAGRAEVVVRDLTPKIEQKQQRRLIKQKAGNKPTLCLKTLFWWASRESNTAPTDYEFAVVTAYVGKST
jgi:hypothetical protein